MLGDISGISKIYCITGRTDMRRSIDGLMAIIRDTYNMDPYANAVYLFCGKRHNTLKALYFDKTGFCLLYKRLDCKGRFQWPRNASEVRPLTRQEFRWLLEGLAIDQPKAIQPAPKTDSKAF
jgi:transposase